MYNPPHPGEFIKETYLEPFGYSCRFLAKQLDVASSALNRILKGQSGVAEFRVLSPCFQRARK